MIKCSSRRAKTKDAGWGHQNKRYDQIIEQYRINRLFQQDQKRVYQQLNEKAESSKKPDGVQGYWLKNFPALHERISTQMDGMINNEMNIPKWMKTGKTILCQKDPGKGNAVDNYRPFSGLPLLWKLMTGIIANSVYEYLEMYKFLPVEQKGCRRNSQGTKD